MASPHRATSAEVAEKIGADPKARLRVIVDNDFGGDCDGLFALAHHLLSPSVEIRGIVGSHNYPDGFYGYPGSPRHACTLARDLLRLMELDESKTVYRGADERLTSLDKPIESDAAKFIVREAMRKDQQNPLYVACGAGLTDLASAFLIEPRIGERVRLVWIGGPEYDGLAEAPPGGSAVEYNLGIDIRAAQVVFNRSNISIWQAPRDAYRQALVSHAELRARMIAKGKLAGFLMGRLDDLMSRADHSLGEAYVLGDNPLVLLTALQSAWEADPSSSKYVSVPAPRINDAGQYEPNPEGRSIRVYTQLDNRLMFEDFYAKLATFDERSEATGAVPASQ